jgi:hypothetical protein
MSWDLGNIDRLVLIETVPHHFTVERIILTFEGLLASIVHYGDPNLNIFEKMYPKSIRKL